LTARRRTAGSVLEAPKDRLSIARHDQRPRDSEQPTQVSDGNNYEHSVDWAPHGDEIVFASDRSPETDQFFNYDLFALKLGDGSMRRLTATENAEYDPKWSPDGTMIAFRATKRGLTDRETTMEDTHVWVMNADGSNRRELATIDNRQGAPVWAPDGKSVYFTLQERGSVHLYRQAVESGKPELLLSGRGSVNAFSVAKSGAIAYSFTSPRDMAELYVRNGPSSKQLTDLTCTAGQTNFFDGTFWACVDFPVGATGLQRIQADFPPNAGQLSTIATQEVSAACPSGKKVVGGGYLFFFGGPTVPIRTNAPTLTLNAWLVSGTNPANTPWRLSAIAICTDAN